MSASRLASAAIKIPKRIERGPTDILKALASTVKYIPSEPDQYVQDDPFLIPIRPLDKNYYVASKLSGKSTAKFLLNKHPEIFYRDDAEPKVRSFLPPEEYREDMVFDEGDVKLCIENKDPVNAVVAYTTLEKANVRLSKDTLLDFFEMLCYTNEDKLEDLLVFQKDYFTRTLKQELVNQTWKPHGIASKIFSQLKEDTDASRIYSAMIAGLSKFSEHATAKQLFDEFNEFHSDKGLYASAYDGLIRSIPNLNSSVESAHQAVEQLVRHMEQHLVKPDLLVFNSILAVYPRFPVDEGTVRNSFKLVNDMRTLGIEPSLFTCQNLIGIICRSRQRTSFLSVISETLDYILACQDITEVRDNRDLSFLRQTMSNVTNQLNSLPMANKVHRIFMKIPHMFPNSSTRQGYLDAYFRLIVTTERMEEIWNFYTSYVPSNFKPSIDTYNALIEALDLYKADKSIIKRIGSDILLFRLADKIRDDTIFKEDPDYIEQLSQSMMGTKERLARQDELLKMEE